MRVLIMLYNRLLEINIIMVNSSDAVELKYYWKAWHNHTSYDVKNIYMNYIEMLNYMAQLNSNLYEKKNIIHHCFEIINTYWLFHYSVIILSALCIILDIFMFILHVTRFKVNNNNIISYKTM